MENGFLRRGSRELKLLNIDQRNGKMYMKNMFNLTSDKKYAN